MGSPDPDKRQIDGLGGGLSSLSKTAIVGPPSPTLASQLKLSGTSFQDVIDYADNLELANSKENGWDLVYRFGQVPVGEGWEVDWTSTCGNLVSAVALFGLHQGYVPQVRIEEVFKGMEGRGGVEGDKMMFPVRLLVASSGQIVKAEVPLTLYKGGMWYPDVEGGTTISGVPGRAPGILISTPLKSSLLLPTGNQSDTVTVGSTSYLVTIINAGLPTIFLPSSSLSSVLDPAQLPSLSPGDLDNNTSLMSLLDKIRVQSSNLTPYLQKTLSPSAPKICIVHPKPNHGYISTGGQKVEGDEMDLLIRAVSVGNLHTTVPATCLSALAAGRAFKESTIEQAVREGYAGEKGEGGNGDMLSIKVGQPAGVSEASVKVREPTEEEKGRGLERIPESIVYYRTARRIIDGFVDVPHSFLSS